MSIMESDDVAVKGYNEAGQFFDVLFRRSDIEFAPIACLDARRRASLCPPSNSLSITKKLALSVGMSINAEFSGLLLAVACKCISRHRTWLLICWGVFNLSIQTSVFPASFEVQKAIYYV